MEPNNTLEKTKKKKIIAALGKAAVLFGSLILVAVFGMADYVIEPFPSLTVFYLLPMTLAVWFVNIWAGALVFIASIAACLADDIFSSPFSMPPFVAYSQVLVKLILLGAFTYILYALKKAFERESRLSRTDALTQAANRRYFFETADLEIKRSSRYKRPLSLAYMDIDGFKHVNDTRGHNEGDRLLRVTSKSLKSSVRVHDIVARMGGDEFVILFPETTYEASQKVIERVRKSLLAQLRENKWPVTVSIGAVTTSGSVTSLDDLITEADKLLYQVKKSGKNKIKHKSL